MKKINKMKILINSFFSIRRFYIFLSLLIICIFMLIIESKLPKNWWSNRIISKSNSFNGHTDLDDDLQRLKDYEAGDLANEQSTPKLPFNLDQFGDYEPVFLSHKVIHLDRKLSNNEKNFFKNFKLRINKDREHLNELLIKHYAKKRLDNEQKDNELINKNEYKLIDDKLSINKPLITSTPNTNLNDKSSSKQQIFKRHMLTSLNQSSQKIKNLNLDKLDRITENVRKLTEQNPLSILKFKPKNLVKINRIYLLSYFRSGSSFLGDLLQQNYRTFYQFEPLHFRSIASRLPTNDSKTNNSISLVLHMINQCNFHSKATINYLNWISKDDNKFLLSWNHFLFSLCKYNQTKCSDSNFVEQVCNLAEHRVTKLTRVNLNDLIKVMKQDNTFEDYIKMNFNKTFINYQLLNNNYSNIINNTIIDFNSTKLIFNINSNNTDNRLEMNNLTTTSILSLNSTSSITINSEPIKIIYLVRDPRAIYSSRQHLNWCKNRASCASIDKLCDEMNEDFKFFEILFKENKSNNGLLTLINNTNKYPIQLFLVRFEIIALEPLKTTNELFKFVNLPFKENIKRFVLTHTASQLDLKDGFKTPFKKWYLNKVSNDPHSTKRNSSKIPFDWINKLTWNKIDEIQNKCKYSMDKLGYKSITNEQFKSISKTNLTDLLLINKINYTSF